MDNAVILENTEIMENIGIATAAPDLTVICIQSTSPVSGEIYHRYSPDPMRFSTMYQMITLIDGLCDSIGYPIRETNLRSFQKATLTPRRNFREVKRIMDFSDLKEKNGKEATFMVHVQFRQNATWQGQVTWVEKKETQNFRSALELMKLMDSALNGEKNANN